MTKDLKLFLNWLLKFSLIFFFFFLMWDQGILGELLLSDKSFITSIIFVLFFIICSHCDYHTYIISCELNKANMSGTFLSVPDREEMQVVVNEQLIVELYSK